jgi:hypothetical protein
MSFIAAGTVTTTQTPGNCTINECDGVGNIVAVADDTDLPVDSLQCTNDVCTAGVPSNPPLPDNTACSQSYGTNCEAGVCNATFVVLRVGDGSAALSTAATPIFLEEHFADGTLVTRANNPLALPTAVAGANARCTLGGTPNAEGQIERSENGHLVAFGCYDAAVGTATPMTTAPATTNRIACSVDSSFNIDTSSRFNTAFATTGIRGAVTSDGTRFWASGGNAPATGGVWTIALGSTGGTQIAGGVSATRMVEIFAGQLYVDSGTAGSANVMTVGAGEPTAGPAALALLPGLPGTGADPFSFVMFDMNDGVPGLDTLYVADQRAVASGGGILKYTFDGTTWTLVNTFSAGFTTGCRGVTGYVSGTNTVTLFATSDQTSANNVIRVIDDGSATPAGVIIATAPANTVYRGITLAPQP